MVVWYPCHTAGIASCRALALKQISSSSSRDVVRVILKEAGAGCMMGESVNVFTAQLG